MAFAADPIAVLRRSNALHAVAKILLLGSAGALALITTSCNKPQPKGQVIAVVNGEEITVAELNEEAKGRGISIGNDAFARRKVAQDLVDRKLLAQLALHDKVDTNPEFLLSSRRLKELLLAQKLVDLRSGAADPTAADVVAFIKAHPHAFDQRVSLRTGQIIVATKLPAKVQADLSTASTLDQAQQLLTAAGISGARSEQVLDSANLPEATMARLLPASGDLLLLPAGEGMAIVQVLSVTPQPTAPGQRVSTARDWLRQHRTNDALEELLDAAKSKARVEYQKGFEPSG
jgi:peptidyl-prolyl cis-trans isomerase C